MKKEEILSLIVSVQGISVNRASSVKVSQISTGPRLKIINQFKDVEGIKELFVQNSSMDLDTFASVLATASNKKKRKNSL